jgi:hypothetical protein
VHEVSLDNTESSVIVDLWMDGVMRRMDGDAAPSTQRLFVAGHAACSRIERE